MENCKHCGKEFNPNKIGDSYFCSATCGLYEKYNKLFTEADNNYSWIETITTKIRKKHRASMGKY